MGGQRPGRWCGAAAALAVAVLLRRAAVPAAAVDPNTCDNTWFDGLTLQPDACITQPNASWVRSDAAPATNEPSAGACCARCRPVDRVTTLGDAVCVWTYCPPQSGPAGCTDGQGQTYRPGECRTDRQNLPFTGQAPVILRAGGRTTTVSGMKGETKAVELAAGPHPPGYTLAGPLSFFLAGFNGICAYDTDAAFNASVADRRCAGQGTLIAMAAQCSEFPSCGGFVYYPISGTALASGGVARFSYTKTPAFEASPGFGFLKSGFVDPRCAFASPYSLLYIRDGGPRLAGAGVGVGGGGGLSGGAVAGIAVAAAVAVAALTGAALLSARWHYAARHPPAGGDAEGGKAQSGGGRSGGAPPGALPPIAGGMALEHAHTGGMPLRPSTDFASLTKSVSGRVRRFSRSLSEGWARAPSIRRPSGPVGSAAASGAPRLDKQMSLERLIREAAANRARSGSLARLGTQHDDAALGAGLPFSDWEVDPRDVAIQRRPDGSDWLLGSGAHANVYKGLLHGVHEVAVKVFTDQGGADAAASGKRHADLRREIALLRSLRDRNIVAFMGASIREGSTVLLTEYASRGDLFRALQADGGHRALSTSGSVDAAADAAQGGRPASLPGAPSSWSALGGSSGGGSVPAGGGRRFTWAPAYTPGVGGRRRRRPGTGLNWSVALDVARGLHYLHTRGVVHLDVKSANIMLTNNWVAKLGDVGISRILTEERRLATVREVGTFAWAAPEVLLGGRRVTEKADVWSFGVVLWELSTGDAPPDSRNLPRVDPADAPPAVAAMMERCLADDPGARPTALDLVHFFDAGLAAADAAAGARRPAAPAAEPLAGALERASTRAADSPLDGDGAALADALARRRGVELTPNASGLSTGGGCEDEAGAGAASKDGDNPALAVSGDAPADSMSLGPSPWRPETVHEHAEASVRPEAASGAPADAAPAATRLDPPAGGPNPPLPPSSAVLIPGTMRPSPFAAASGSAGGAGSAASLLAGLSPFARVASGSAHGGTRAQAPPSEASHQGSSMLPGRMSEEEERGRG